jgi:glyoxylase-like metal-dependent hydrolase (beta-lactamase superfamily II)
MSDHRSIFSRRDALAAGAVLAAPAILGRAAASPRAEPRPRPEPPGFRRFRLGSVEITVLSDGGAMIDGPWPVVGEDRPKEEVEQLMRDRLLPPSRFRPGFSPVLVDAGRERLLIDAGNGANGFLPRPSAGRLLEAMRAAGVEPEEIDVVALTHCHADHIGGLVESGRPAFPNARIVVGEIEHAFWSGDERLGAAQGSNELLSATLFRSAVSPLRDRTALVRPGAELIQGVSAVAAYGHTPGHLAFEIGSGNDRLLVWGDCAHHQVASLAHPEWSALFDMDKETAKDTRRRIYDMAAQDRIPVLGYHMSFPSLGFLERSGTGFRWLPVTDQLAE